MKQNSWVRLLTYVTGLVNQFRSCSSRTSTWPAENRILRAQLPARLHLSDSQRATLPEIGKLDAEIRSRRRTGKAVSAWRREANSFCLTGAELDRMAPAIKCEHLKAGASPNNARS